VFIQKPQLGKDIVDWIENMISPMHWMQVELIAQPNRDDHCRLQELTPIQNPHGCEEEEFVVRCLGEAMEEVSTRNIADARSQRGSVQMLNAPQ
jgi:hypothetical protein